MPNQYLSNTTVQDNPWVLYGDSEQTQRLASQTGLPLVAAAQPLDAPTIVAKAHWAEFVQQLDTASRPLIALLVQGQDELDEIEALIHSSGLTPDAIWVDFPVFSDGRGYSLCQLLRRQYQGQLPIGAVGDILQDQIFFYWRCGFSLMMPRHDQNIEACAKGLNDFSHAYQPSYHQP